MFPNRFYVVSVRERGELEVTVGSVSDHFTQHQLEDEGCDCGEICPCCLVACGRKKNGSGSPPLFDIRKY